MLFVLVNLFLQKKDKVVFIDDFLTNGHPAFGVKNLIEQAGAELLGMGFVIEKSFQKGRACLLEEDSLVESLVRRQ
ncbi:Xanthine phosphoribosyltransferase [Weeksella virosa]|uniref:hypothetical protein n=1 Tax=Weeksella virosa TaxID=1014 RepID=UPI000F6CCDAD|nr:hypothetical protein [Weeksella virosa]MDK7674681.1 hypothetical protein [Weeksella virosa]VEH63996.1 Xanthine phosphoribosyltransferase [Weeksella virosa]